MDRGGCGVGTRGWGRGRGAQSIFCYPTSWTSAQQSWKAVCFHATPIYLSHGHHNPQETTTTQNKDNIFKAKNSYEYKDPVAQFIYIYYIHICVFKDRKTNILLKVLILICVSDLLRNGKSPSLTSTIFLKNMC